MNSDPIKRRKIMQLMGLGVSSMVLPGLTACSAGTDDLTAMLKKTATPFPDSVDFSEFVPGTEEIYQTIETIFDWGIRRPGYPADQRTEDYLVEQFNAFGLENVRKEPVPVNCWEPKQYSLEIITSEQTMNIDCFPVPYSAGEVDLTLELSRFDEAEHKQMDGCAALRALPLIEFSATLLAEGGPELEFLRENSSMPINPSGTVIDLEGTLRGSRQKLPFSSAVADVMGPVQKAGAGAFIGYIKGHPGDICEYYVPYHGVSNNFPGVWIRESDGERLQALLLDSDVKVRIRVKAEQRMTTSYNIVAELPGADDEVVQVGSHHDGPWASAVEDASGVALVLAQASYWAKVPVKLRPHRLQFVLHAGHMVGSAGGFGFVKAHADELDQMVLEIHLEHVACEVREGEGGMELTGLPAPRWFFTSQNPVLEQSVINALTVEQVDRSLVLAPNVMGWTPSTDGGMYHMKGVPIVNFLAAPVYLFDPSDTLDKVHQPSLEPITRATIRIIEGTRGISAQQMRDGISA